MTEEGPKPNPNIILSRVSGDVLMAAARRCSHRGSWKVASGVGWRAGCGRQWRCEVPWLFRQRLLRGCRCGCCSGWKNTEPNTARKPPHFLLRIEEVLLGICSRYFLLTCHDVKTKYRAKYRGKYRDKIS